jgi:uncharacterized protein
LFGDLISPFKAAVGLDYKAFENRLMRAIHLRYGLPANPSDDDLALIKRADHIAAYFEATQLAGFKITEARKFFGTPKGVAAPRLEPLASNAAQARYLERFRRLSA